MTSSQALAILGECRWLKITANHVSATMYRTRAELLMLTPEQCRDPYVFHRANVMVRRSKKETLESLLVRAATLIESGHRPKVRVPAVTGKELCACGAKTDRLVWNYQLKQRVCRRCDAQWARAARNNDMRPSTGDVQ